MTAAGKLDRPVQFLARPAYTGPAGTPRPGFAALGGVVWAAFAGQPSFRIAVGDFHVNVPLGVLTVRDDPFTRTIGRAHQVDIEGQRFTIRAASLPDRHAGTISFEVLGAESQSTYADYVDAEGEVVVVRRIGPPLLEVNARARVTGYRPKDLVPGTRQGDRQILLLAADLADGGFPLPLLQSDRIVVRGAPLTMRALDDSTHRFAGELFAYDIVAAG